MGKQIPVSETAAGKHEKVLPRTRRRRTRLNNKISGGEGEAKAEGEEKEAEDEKEMADETVDAMVPDECDNSVICAPSDYE